MSWNGTVRYRIAAIRGTMRPGNYTAMALDLVVDEIGRPRFALEAMVRAS